MDRPLWDWPAICICICPWLCKNEWLWPIPRGMPETVIMDGGGSRRLSSSSFFTKRPCTQETTRYHNHIYTLVAIHRQTFTLILESAKFLRTSYFTFLVHTLFVRAATNLCTRSLRCSALYAPT